MHDIRITSAPLRALIGFSMLASIALPAPGQLIDFESTPAGGLPTDNAFLSTPYNLSGGGTVAFFFDHNGNLIFNPGTDTPGTFEAAGDADPNPGYVNF